MPAAEIEACVRPRPLQLTNARYIEPLFHADGCPGLSGIYSIINSIRLVLADRRPLSSSDEHELIKASFKFLEGRVSLEQANLSGMRLPLWRGLGEALCAASRSRFRCFVWFEQLHLSEPMDESSVFVAIDNALVKQRAVLMLMRGGHYTVIKASRPSSLSLFDSSGAYWIAKSGISMPRRELNSRHFLLPASFHTVRW